MTLRATLAAVLAAIVVGPAAAQISTNSTVNPLSLTTPPNTGDVTALTWSHTVAAGSNRVVAVTVGSEDIGGTSTEGLVSTVRFNGTLLTRVDASQQTAANLDRRQRSEIWYGFLGTSATAVTGAVEVTYAGTVTRAVGASVVLNGVQQSAAAVFGGGSGAGDATNSPGFIQSRVITPPYRSWLLDYGIHGSSLATNLAATGPGHQAYFTQPTPDLVAGLGRVQDLAPTSDITFGWDGSPATNRLTHSVIGFAPVPEPATVLGVAAAGLLGLRRLRRAS